MRDLDMKIILLSGFRDKLYGVVGEALGETAYKAITPMLFVQSCLFLYDELRNQLLGDLQLYEEPLEKSSDDPRL